MVVEKEGAALRKTQAAHEQNKIKPTPPWMSDFPNPPAGEGDGAVDPWEHKEMMCKSWTDAVFQRILLRQAEGPERSTCEFLVKWDKPPGQLVDGFCISEDGIRRAW